MVTDETVALVARFEGYRRHVYRDAVGVETIGYGETNPRLIARYRSGGISEPDARRLLKRRLSEFGAGVRRLVGVPLTPRQHGALTSLAYNIGLGAFGQSTLRRKLNAGEYAAVPAEFMKWTKAGGQQLQGLVRRRRAEVSFWLKGSGNRKLNAWVRSLRVARARSERVGWPLWLRQRARKLKRLIAREERRSS